MPVGVESDAELPGDRPFVRPLVNTLAFLELYVPLTVSTGEIDTVAPRDGPSGVPGQ